MKKIVSYGTLIISVLLLASASLVAQSRATSIDLIPNEEVNQQKLALAKDMAHKLLNGMKNKQYYLLKKDEAIDILYEKFRKAEQEQFYAKVSKDLGGDYNGQLDFEEVHFVKKPNNEPDLYMFRFKNSFPLNSEVRVYVHTDQDVFSGIVVTPWIDQIYDYSKFSLNNK